MMTQSDVERIAGLESKLTSEIKRIDQRVDALDKTTAAKFVQADVFNKTLSELNSTMATQRELDNFKEQYQDAHEILRTQVGNLNQRLDLSAGKNEGISTASKVLVTALSSVLVLLGIYTAVQATNDAHIRTFTQTQTIEEHATTVTVP